jgi:hypothetical protein
MSSIEDVGKGVSGKSGTVGTTQRESAWFDKSLIRYEQCKNVAS